MSKLFLFGDTISDAYPIHKKELPSIELLQYESGQKREETLLFTEIVLVVEGSFLLSYDHFFDHKIDKGKIVLLSPGCHFTVRPDSYATALIFRVKNMIQFSKDYLTSEKKVTPINGTNSLEVKPEIESFISLLKESMENGLLHEAFLTHKCDELLYLLQYYYEKEELKAFFSPLLTSNAHFYNFILQNFRKIKTVKEFADKYKCSVSKFEKTFHDTFGTSAYKWMKEKRITLLYYEINMTNKPLRQIAKEQMFLSLPQFNDFCKKHFGYPPGKMRKLASMFSLEKV